MSNIVQVTPFIFVADLAAALEFFTNVLGGVVPFRMRNYAYLALDSVGLRIVEEPGRQPTAPEVARNTIYIDVLDVDGLYAELKARLQALPPADVKGPSDQSWGQRELSVRMPDGNWLAFGQAIRG